MNDIVPRLQQDDIFEHRVLSVDYPLLYLLQRGQAIRTSGTAEMLEYGAARYEGDKFVPFDEAGIVAAAAQNHLFFPTGHVAPYRNDTVSVRKVSGFVDFDNPCVEVTGDLDSFSRVFRLKAAPVLIN